MLTRLEIMPTPSSLETIAVLSSAPWGRSVQFGDDNAPMVTFRAEFESSDPDIRVPMTEIVASISIRGKDGRSTYGWCVYSPRDASSQIGLQHVGDADAMADAYRDAMSVVARLSELPGADFTTYPALIAARRKALGRVDA